MLDALIGWIIRVAVVGGAFGMLILVHEFGHFVVARLLGVRVLTFSIGFGPKLFSWKGKVTEYVVAWLPLGGFVRMAGENPQERSQQPDEFLSKPAWVRSLIVLAGPAVNYLTAVVLLWVFLMKGYTGLLPVVGNVMEGLPAQTVGIQTGDTIKAIDGREVRTWDEMTALIHDSAGKTLDLKVLRGATEVAVKVVPKSEPVTTRTGEQIEIGLIGVNAGSARFGPGEALVRSVNMQNYWMVLTLKAFGSLLTGKRKLADSMTGPLGIMKLTSEAADMGYGPLLMLLSLFSLSLFIFNLFPVPVLDGGHLLFLAIEKLRGRPVSMAVQEKAALVGMVLLVSLALVVSVNDINRFWLRK